MAVPQIKQLTQSISDIETEIKSLQEEKSQLSMQQPTSEAGTTPSEIAKAAKSASLADQKRRSELESVNAAIATLNQHLNQKQTELGQAQRQKRRESLTAEVEAARGEMVKAVESINKFSGQLKTQLIDLKALANENQPIYSQLQREFTSPDSKPEEFLKISFTGLPVVTRQGSNFVLEGQKLNLFWAEEAAEAQRQAEAQARRVDQKSQFEQASHRRELENLVKYQGQLEAQRQTKETELENFKQKLIEVRQAGGYSTQPVEGAIAKAKQEILDLNRQIHDLESKITDLEAQKNDAAA